MHGNVGKNRKADESGQLPLLLGANDNGICPIHHVPMRMYANGKYKDRERIRYECPLCRAAGRTKHKELVARLERGDFEGMGRIGPQARQLIDPKLLDAYDNYKKDKAKQHRLTRCKRLQLKYDITQEDYERMYEEQGGHCKICGAKKSLLYVDHCHKTGKVRGLLCSNCNTGIGQLQDNVEILRSAITYLEAA